MSSFVWIIPVIVVSGSTIALAFMNYCKWAKGQEQVVSLETKIKQLESELQIQTKKWNKLMKSSADSPNLRRLKEITNEGDASNR